MMYTTTYFSRELENSSLGRLELLRKKTEMKSQSFLAPLFLLLFIVVLHSEQFTFVLHHLRSTIVTEGDASVISTPHSLSEAAEKESCDMFSGKWIYDETYPPYQEKECPYIPPQLTCQEHGRPEHGYQHWRWQPRGCNLPRFNASFALEKLRGKRMLFVGDSLNRGQFTSMVCLLHRAIPDGAKSMETIDSLTVFRAKEYNATVEFYWAPFLLESNSDNAIVHRVTDRIVRAENLQTHGQHWLGADIIVFNTYLWWMTGFPMKILQGSFADEEKNITVVQTDEAYRIGLESMVRWVENNMDLRKNRIFFSTMSPLHERGYEWGGGADENCYNQTAPIEDPAYWGSGSNKIMMKVVREELVEKSRFPITLLNITQLSEYRKDAHTQIYKQQWYPPTMEQLANPKSYADCVHWCLPGLQDTWNELLYTELFFP